MDVRLPKIGDTATSGTVVSVLVKVGDTVAPGQTVLELEIEKAISPIPSSAGGTVTAIHVKEGDKISVGSVILALDGGSGSTTPAPAAAPAAKSAAPRTAKRAPAPVEVDDDLDADEADSEAGDDGPIPAASPYVRKVARELGIKLSRVRGSESGGRVVMADIARYITRLERGVSRAGRHAEEPKGLVFQPVNQDFSAFGPITSESLSPLRKIIASRMVENSVSLPHVTQFDEVDMSRVESLRAKFKAAYEKAGARLTPTPFIIKALVKTLQKHPRFNSSVNEVTDTIILKHYFHIGIAVDTDAGLLVPVLRDAVRSRC